MDGRIFTASEVKAWWAYGELSSKRWRDRYAPHLPPQIIALAEAGAPFSALSAEFQALLVQAIRTVRVRPFIDSLDDASGYAISDLTRQQLLRLWVIPMFGPQGRNWARYAVFLAGQAVRDDDPRAMLERLPPTAYRQDHPIIVTAYQDGGKLVEGYLRSLLFMRDAPADWQLRALCPVGLALPT